MSINHNNNSCKLASHSTQINSYMYTSKPEILATT